jgi:hypothetical protein
MRKSDMGQAVKEQWRVKDDFGAIGLVRAQSGGDHLAVVFEHTPSWRPEIVHYQRVNRVEDDA